MICSSALDPNCAQRPSVLSAEHCSVPSDGQCYSRIQDGATVRGCRDIVTSSEVEQCRNTTASSQCTISQGAGSNIGIIPQNRRRCYHCDGRVDATCSENPTNASSLLLPCKRFSQPESCLTLKLNGAGTLRLSFKDFSLSYHAFKLFQLFADVLLILAPISVHKESVTLVTTRMDVIMKVLSRSLTLFVCFCLLSFCFYKHSSQANAKENKIVK